MMAICNRTRKIVFTGFFAALTAIGAFIKIPLYYVPVTLQTFFTFTAGSMLPPAPAAFSQLVYLLLGLLGLPVFAGGGGLGYVLRPTFGYLFGLPFSAFFISRLVRRGATAAPLWRIFTANALGALVVYIFGVSWLFVSIRFIADAPLSLSHAIISGAILFLPVDLLKALFAASLARAVNRRLNWS